MAKWEWDEILLACDLVAQNNWRELRPGDPPVVELSEFLRVQVTGDVLSADPEFRNPNGVSRKTIVVASSFSVRARHRGHTPRFVTALLISAACSRA